mmetsp:Transcript_139285/g.277736  ORF Transcript_139285/g.277736 Transcript_139285/m.277736 type:complete len:113 (-) Transcript_139285:350-688(-)
MPQALQWYVRDRLKACDNYHSMETAMHGTSAVRFTNETNKMHADGLRDNAGQGAAQTQSLAVLSAAPLALAAGSRPELRRVAAGTAIFFAGLTLPGLFRSGAARVFFFRARP